MLEYTGTIEVIVDPHTMATQSHPFVFKTKHILGRVEVKKEAINALHEQVMVYGVQGIRYDWRVL
jgi:hypothetical protein